MWRIVAAAALVASGARNALERVALPDGAASITTAPLCVTEGALIAVLCIEQPLKWWYVLGALVVYFVVPILLQMAVSPPYVDRVSDKIGHNAVARIKTLIAEPVAEAAISGAAVALLARDVIKKEVNRPWMSLALAIALTSLIVTNGFGGSFKVDSAVLWFQRAARLKQNPVESSFNVSPMRNKGAGLRF